MDINTPSNKKLTPLHVASHHGMHDNVKFLLTRQDIKVNVIDAKGDTPLHHAGGKNKLRRTNS